MPQQSPEQPTHHNANPWNESTRGLYGHANFTPVPEATVRRSRVEVQPELEALQPSTELQFAVDALQIAFNK